jgi:hypothetical protein
VGDVDHHADPVHLVDHSAAEACQSGVVGRVAAEPGQVLTVVGHQHRPHAKVVIGLDHADLAAERVRVLQIEAYDQPTLLLGGQHVVDS